MLKSWFIPTKPYIKLHTYLPPKLYEQDACVHNYFSTGCPMASKHAMIYAYSGSRNTLPLSTLFRWVVSKWSHCSKTCGRGKHERSIRCLEEVAPDDFRVTNSCSVAKPQQLTSLVCNQYPCPASWFTGNWSAVSCSYLQN